MTRKFFRSGDKVTVHGLILADGKDIPGRVICTNRRSKYGEIVIVLCDVGGGSELVEAFCEDGSRYLKESACHITLGWKVPTKELGAA